jgi:KH-domain-like of EngA bacterial GTPase enzymes, C-terminal
MRPTITRQTNLRMTAVLILFGNSVASIPESDKRYLVNGLRETFGLVGVPIRLSMRSGGDNPYAPKRRRGERFCRLATRKWIDEGSRAT